MDTITTIILLAVGLLTLFILNWIAEKRLQKKTQEKYDELITEIRSMKSLVEEESEK